jgi:hypothetical protein
MKAPIMLAETAIHSRVLARAGWEAAGCWTLDMGRLSWDDASLGLREG